MKLNIDNLAIEVTRKCNMNCEHCLRGSAQRKIIPDNYIHKMLQLIDSLSTLTISGGEPTLAFDALEQIKHCITYDNCFVNNFYMVTNGKSINVDKLAEWAYQMLSTCGDNEMSGIAFSFDDYHTQTLNRKQEEKRTRNFYKLKEKLEEDYGVYENGCGEDFITKHTVKGYMSVIKEGRAKDFGTREENKTFFEEETYDFDGEETVCLTDTVLYLSCNGNIVAGCDWSYDTIDNRKDVRIAYIEDINCTDDLIEAIRNYQRKYYKWHNFQSKENLSL